MYPEMGKTLIFRSSRLKSDLDIRLLYFSVILILTCSLEHDHSSKHDLENYRSAQTSRFCTFEMSKQSF